MMNNFVYKFINYDNQIIYIGKTSNLKQRMKQHFGATPHLDKSCYEQVYKIFYANVETKFNSELLETYLIKKYHPQYNKDKNYKKENQDIEIDLPEPQWKELFFLKVTTKNNLPGIEFLKEGKAYYHDKNIMLYESAKKFLFYDKSKIERYSYEFYKYSPTLMAKIQDLKELKNILTIAEKNLNIYMSNLDEYISSPVEEQYDNNYIAFNLPNKEELPLFNFYLKTGVIFEIDSDIYGLKIFTPLTLKNIEKNICE